MFQPRFSTLITLSLFVAAAALVFAADQPPAPQDSHPQDSQKTPPATGKPTAGKPATPAAPAGGGVVVFIDPATGQIRQPDASEIGALVTPAGGPAPKAPEPILMQGPGGAVGARLGQDAMTYMVVTTTPDGKLAMDCVTGEKAAAARVTATPDSQAKESSTGSVPQQDKQHPQDTQHHPQDTQNVKIPR